MTKKTEKQQQETVPQRLEEDLNDLMKRRREELDGLKALGVNPYPSSFQRTATLAEARASFRDDGDPIDVVVGGRIMSIRRMGKASFCHIQDESGRLQVYLKKEELGSAYDAFRLMDIGDIIGVKGFVFRTRMGEISIHAREMNLLSKSLRPLPVVKEKVDEQGTKTTYDPFSDKELRYRQRYVDLIVNEDVRSVFVLRSKVISTLRSFLDSRGFLEVETPILQPVYGGANARPFTAYHNALGLTLYLRIADELYLKRLIVGGFEAVYEISKDFRNEGIDRTHNPEFTMLELYVAYRDYLWMMDFVEEMVEHLVKTVHGNTTVEFSGREIDFTRPWKRMSMMEAIEHHTGHDVRSKNEKDLRGIVRALGLEVDDTAGRGRLIDEIFSERVEPKLVQPTFITDYPVEMSPLAKKHRSEEGLVERFELIVNGQELCNAFSELNDPLDQRSRFEDQRTLKLKGDEEAHPLDEDYLRALEYGMPPTAGLGVGIDRLVMLMTGRDSIRDVILFPQMKPET